MNFANKIDGKISVNVKLFLHELKLMSPSKHERAQKDWESYKPELKKCQNKDEIARLLMSFFQRAVKSVKDELDGKTFYKFRYTSVGKFQQCLYELRIHKNTIKDYTKHIHSIEGAPLERGIRMADEKKFEKPEDLDTTPKKPITTKELKRRIEKKEIRSETNLEIILAALFAIFSLGFIIIKILT